MNFRTYQFSNINTNHPRVLWLYISNCRIRRFQMPQLQASGPKDEFKLCNKCRIFSPRTAKDSQQVTSKMTTLNSSDIYVLILLQTRLQFNIIDFNVVPLVCAVLLNGYIQISANHSNGTASIGKSKIRIQICQNARLHKVILDKSQDQ